MSFSLEYQELSNCNYEAPEISVLPGAKVRERDNVKVDILLLTMFP